MDGCTSSLSAPELDDCLSFLSIPPSLFTRVFLLCGFLIRFLRISVTIYQKGFLIMWALMFFSVGWLAFFLFVSMMRIGVLSLKYYSDLRALWFE